MLAGYVVLFISIIALLPWGDDYPPVAIPSINIIRFTKIIFES